MTNLETAIPKSRFEALDAWRGLCAVLVATFHLQAYSHLYNSALIRHSFLFVDFFFVLSGFVITASYREKLLAGFSVWQFMFLRLGRLYPLHFVILVTFIGIEVLRYRFNGLLGGAEVSKFSQSHSIEAIFTNIFLIQSLGIHKMLTWNLPSWSISVEFYTYAVFAIMLLFLTSRSYIFIAVVVLVSPILLFKFVGNIDTDYDFGFLRCLFGFFIGVGCYDLYLLMKKNGHVSDIVSAGKSLIEICAIGLVLLFVCFFGEGAWSLGAPLVFGQAVIIFSFESGAVSNILRARPFMFLGKLSYSIYMIYTLVLIAMAYVCELAERELNVLLRRHGYFGLDMWQGDIAYGVLILLTVGAAYLTFTLVEQPGRRQSRRIANRLFGTTMSSRVYPANPSYIERSQHNPDREMGTYTSTSELRLSTISDLPNNKLCERKP